MSQSRFSIVLVGVSALLRRPLVSRLRPAAFSARDSGGFRRSALPSVSAFAARRVGLRAHRFPFSACTASELPSASWRFRSAGWPSGSRLPLFGTHRFGVALGELTFGLTASAFRHAPLRSCSRRVGSSAFRFRFSARTASGLPLGGLVLLPSASAFRHAPLRGCPWRVGLRAYGFRFSARTASGLPSAGWFFCLPLRRLPLGELAFGLTASAFRHAPLRGCRSVGWPSGSRLPLFGTHRFGITLGELALLLGGLVLLPSASEIAARRVDLRAHDFRFSARIASEWLLGELVLPPSASEIAARRVGLRAHCFRFSACTASEWPLGEFVLSPSASEIALGGLAFGLTASAFRHAPLRSSCWASWFFRLLLRRLPLGELAFGLTASAFRHAPIRSGRWMSSFFRLPLRRLPSAGWPSGSRLPLFGMHRFGNCPRRVGLRTHCFGDCRWAG